MDVMSIDVVLCGLTRSLSAIRILSPDDILAVV